ncbi:MAG: prepilin-type cleavage/methylation domain-containing protein [Peptococcaceae bacterium]|nr:prepilin-type cleavage/methylation domain-containing protein [Peptococcaceae bacterium]
MLEILLVLVLLAGGGFFLLIQIPHDIQENSIEISASRLLQDLREVQQASMSGNIWYRVKFYSQTNEYMIFKAGEFLRSVRLYPGVVFGNTPPELIFLPSGVPSTGMTVTLRTGDRERKVIIAPVMGRMRIEIER